MTGEIWKRSKKVLTYALALVMVAGVVQTVVPVRADEDEVAAEAVALSTTDTAANTTTAAVAQTWKPTVSYNNGALEISLDESHIENGKTAYYEIWIDNHRDTGASEIKSETKVNNAYCLNRCIWTDGEYKVNIWASDGQNWNDINKDKPNEPVSCSFRYDAPTAKLVINEVKWSEETPGTVTWTLSGNDTSDVLEYEVMLVKSKGNSNLNFMPSVMVDANTTSYDLSEKMTDMDADYTVQVRAVSKKMDTKGSSEYGITQAFYKPADTVNKVTPGIMEALWNTVSNNSSVNTTVSNNLVAGTNNTENIITALKTVSSNSGANNNTVAAAVVEELKKQQTGNGLKMAMQRDSKMIELVEIVEQMAAGTAATTTVSTNDAEAKELFGVSTNDVKAKIKVVGAKLNATSGQTAELKLAKSNTQISEQELREINANKAVSLDIKLTGCGTEGRALDIPVSITMPIPRGLNKSRLEIMHYGNNGDLEYIYPKDSGNGTITFIVSHFSTFVFIEMAGNTGSGGGGRQDDTVEALVIVAEAGATVKTKDITTLSNSTMKALLKRGDVTLVMEYTYQGVDYVVTIPAGKAVDNDIPWYGPLYLAGMYGNGAGTDKADKTADTVYVVKRGDTMSKIAKLSGMSLAELAKKNPQIKNLNRIRVGQSINR